jgi:hypothetical protein
VSWWNNVWISKQISINCIASLWVFLSFHQMANFHLFQITLYIINNMLSVNEACKARNGLGNCSTICLPTATGRTCACKPGGQLKQDGRTCSDSKFPINKDIYSIQCTWKVKKFIYKISTQIYLTIFSFWKFSEIVVNRTF